MAERKVPKFFLPSNGVTMVGRNVGCRDKGMVNGEQYTKCNEHELRDLIEASVDDPQKRLTCISGIKNMAFMFRDVGGLN